MSLEPLSLLGMLIVIVTRIIHLTTDYRFIDVDVAGQPAALEEYCEQCWYNKLKTRRP